jgi:nucleoid-associated protein YgaU
MGLFDELLKTAIGGEAREPEQQSRGLVEGLLDLLQQPGGDGIAGLARTFEQKGLGAESASWIGTGANRPVSSAQVIEALGSSRVDSVSRRAGLGSAAGAAAIAAILPALIDKLTPDGRAPQPERIRELGGSILGAAPGAKRKADFSNVQAGSSSTAPPPAPQERWHTVVPGDSLSKIAKQFYGDAQQWRQIYDANREQVKNPDLIQPGWKLRIPDSAQKRG